MEDIESIINSYIYTHKPGACYYIMAVECATYEWDMIKWYYGQGGLERPFDFHTWELIKYESQH